LTRDGVVKLLDFGIGRLKELKGVATTTLSGATMGTPAFMAPEQARGRWDEVDGQTDLWALGATLFTLLTGEFVHEGQTVNETLALACTQPARLIKTLRPDLPERVAALIDRALAYAKAQRFPDARAMQAEVRLAYAALAGSDVSRAAQLSVPDAEPSAPIVLEPASDPRLRLTTARGVSASGLPAQAAEAWALPRNRRWLLLGAGAALLLVLAILARSCAEPSAPEAAVAASAPTLAAPVAAPAAPSVAPVVNSSVPRVSIDELPREPKRRPSEGRPAVGAATPAKKDDPFARRR
jgi:serine/threonine-protein kinase